MSEYEYTEWLYRYIHPRSVPPQDLPALTAALRKLAADFERAQEVAK